MIQNSFHKSLELCIYLGSLPMMSPSNPRQRILMKYQIFFSWMLDSCIFYIPEARCYHGDGEPRAAIYNSYHHCLGCFFSSSLNSPQYFSLPCHGCLSHFPHTHKTISQEKLSNTETKLSKIVMPYSLLNLSMTLRQS